MPILPSPSPPPPLHTHFTEPTTNYWQSFLPPPTTTPPPPPPPPPSHPPFQFSYPALLPDGRTLLLPIRPLPAPRAIIADDTDHPSPSDQDPNGADSTQKQKEPQPKRALASLLVNHASFSVVEDLSTILAHRISDHFLSHGLSPLPSSSSSPFIDRNTTPAVVVVGIPTLGLTVAPLVAKALGATRYVPLGYSRKFWYEDALSVGVESVTSPGLAAGAEVAEAEAGAEAAAERGRGLVARDQVVGGSHVMSKRAFLDPNLLGLLRGKGVILVDDVISSGRTLNAVWNFLEDERVGCRVLVVAVLMLQGGAWRTLLGEKRAGRVIGVLESPLLRAVDGGWVAE